MVRTGLVLLLLASAALAGDREVSRDDGTKSGHKSRAGTGHVIALKAPKGFERLTSVRIYGSRYGGGYDPAATSFRVSITDPELRPLGETTATYDLFAPVKFDWVDVPFDTPVKVPAVFKIVVAFDPTATRGVYVGHAATTESRSGFGLPGGSEVPFDPAQEWMIRAVLSDEGEGAGEEDRIELALDDGVEVGKRSLGGSGHIVEFRKPAGNWWIDSVRIHGSRYGSGYDPANTPFSVTVTSVALRALRRERAPYSLFGLGEPAWAEVPMTEAIRCPARFRVAVDFAPSSTMGVYLGYSAGDAGASFTGLPGGRAERFPEGPWMVRVVLVREKPGPRAPLLPEPAGPAAYVADFEFVAKIVARDFPAFRKKGVDWDSVVKEFRPLFAAVEDDAAHVLLVRRLLARLGDMHSGVLEAKVDPPVPAFEGLYGAGLWIAREEGKFVLRALAPGHFLAGRLVPGAELVRVDGVPVKEAHAKVRARLMEWFGWSSDHFLDARLSFQFFPFGDARTLPATFVNPDGKSVAVELERWGPAGRGLDRVAVTMPAGVVPEGRAVAARLDPEVGYLRILGGMDEATRDDFFRALDGLRGVKGILLDGRGMGGGGDGPAWEMAGRFFDKPTPHGAVTLKPTGEWQFTGPVVLITDERMVSSAETFTWAMTETGRAIQVGRPTGGATIIPRVHDAPSGLFRFRVGAVDRKTPGLGLQPEGVGSIPRVYAPYTPETLADGRDPELDAARSALDALLR